MDFSAKHGIEVSKILSALPSRSRDRRITYRSIDNASPRSRRILFNFYSIMRNTYTRCCLFIRAHGRHFTLPGRYTLFVLYYLSPWKFSALFSKTLQLITAALYNGPLTLFSVHHPLLPAPIAIDRSAKPGVARWWSILDSCVVVSRSSVHGFLTFVHRGLERALYGGRGGVGRWWCEACVLQRGVSGGSGGGGVGGELSEATEQSNAANRRTRAIGSRRI